jgi:hypothetical protein
MDSLSTPTSESVSLHPVTAGPGYGSGPAGLQDRRRPIAKQNLRGNRAGGVSLGVRRSRRSIDSLLIEAAKHQLGVVTVGQLEALGIDRRLIQARVDSAMLLRMFPNVLRVASMSVSADQRFLAAALSVPGSAISGKSAAYIHQFPPGTLRVLSPNVPGELNVELSVPHKQFVEIKGIEARRRRQALPTERWKGANVTTIPQTVADLAELLPASELAMLLDHLLVKRLTTVDAIRQLVLENKRMVNRQRLLALLDDRSEGRMLFRSRLEFKVGGWLNSLGVPGFQSNYIVHEAGGVEADFAWPSHRVVLEVSPFYTHGSEEKQRRDMIRRRKLLAAGWLVFEVTDADLVSIQTFATAIDHLLRTLRLPSVS